MEKEFVVLVDQDDKQIGLMEKMIAHENAVLHRAFSIFIFNSKGEMLLHQRAFSKYHSPGLWTNACCSHPREDESLEQATSRRLKEEMGMECKLTKAFHFTYKADVGLGLIEHEIDYVFVGETNQTPLINPKEVDNWKYMPMNELTADITEHPEKYTAWFKIAFDRLVEFYNQQKK